MKRPVVSVQVQTIEPNVPNDPGCYLARTHSGDAQIDRKTTAGTDWAAIPKTLESGMLVERRGDPAANESCKRRRREAIGELHFPKRLRHRVQEFPTQNTHRRQSSALSRHVVDGRLGCVLAPSLAALDQVPEPKEAPAVLVEVQ